MKTNKGSAVVIALIVFLVASVIGASYYSSVKKSQKTKVTNDSTPVIVDATSSDVSVPVPKESLSVGVGAEIKTGTGTPKIVPIIPIVPVQVNSGTTSIGSNTTLTNTGTLQNNTTIIQNQNQIQNPTASHCGFIIYSPLQNSTIRSNIPVVFSGIIHNAQAVGCSWTMFEGQAGTAQLWHKDGGIWGKIGPEKTISVTNWMTTGPVPFTVSLGFDNTNPGFVSGMPMKVVFTEENPSGGTPDTLTFPLLFQ